MEAHNNGSLIPFKLRQLRHMEDPREILISDISSDADEKKLCQESDIYLLDRLADELLNIKDLSLNAEKIKKILRNL